MNYSRGRHWSAGRGVGSHMYGNQTGPNGHGYHGQGRYPSPQQTLPHPSRSADCHPAIFANAPWRKGRANTQWKRGSYGCSDPCGRLVHGGRRGRGGMGEVHAMNIQGERGIGNIGDAPRGRERGTYSEGPRGRCSRMPGRIMGGRYYSGFYETHRGRGSQVYGEEPGKRGTQMIDYSRTGNGINSTSPRSRREKWTQEGRWSQSELSGLGGSGRGSPYSYDHKRQLSWDGSNRCPAEAHQQQAVSQQAQRDTDQNRNTKSQESSPRERQDSSPRESQESTPRERQESTSRERQESTSRERQDSTPRERQDSTPRERQDSTSRERQESTPRQRQESTPKDNKQSTPRGSQESTPKESSFVHTKSHEVAPQAPEGSTAPKTFSSNIDKDKEHALVHQDSLSSSSCLVSKIGEDSSIGNDFEECTSETENNGTCVDLSAESKLLTPEKNISDKARLTYQSLSNISPLLQKIGKLAKERVNNPNLKNSPGASKESSDSLKTRDCLPSAPDSEGSEPPIGGSSVRKGISHLRKILSDKPEFDEKECKMKSKDDKGIEMEEDSPDYHDSFNMTNTDLMSSDDEDLPAPPTLTIMPQKTPPKPHSTGPNTGDTKDNADVLQMGIVSPPPHRPAKPTKFSLDALLADKHKRADVDRQLNEMAMELKEDIKQGGVENLALKTDEDDLKPEHRETLNKLEVVEQTIQEQHPGQVVFDRKKYLALFSYPHTLTLQSCAVLPSSNPIEKHLLSLSSDMLIEMVTSNTIWMCFESLAHPTELLDWLFCLMSIHEKSLVIRKIYETITRLLYNDSGKAAGWVPSLKLSTKIFLNYGATLDRLTTSELLPFSHDDFSNENKENENGPPQLMMPPGGGYQRQNMKFVLNVIGLAVTRRHSIYSEDELMALSVMMFHVSLDGMLNEDTLKDDFRICFSALVNSFPENVWQGKVDILCNVLPNVTQHHHNRLHMIQVLPPVPRGAYLQRRLAFAMLQDIMFHSSDLGDLKEFKIKMLAPIMWEVSAKGEADYYLLSSIISLVDYSVGNETLKASEREDLRILTDRLRVIMGEVKEYVNVLDRTMVKDMMVRLSSKWTFMMQNMGTKQRTIFAYASSQSRPELALPVVPLLCVDNDMEIDQSEITTAENQSEDSIPEVDQSHSVTDNMSVYRD